MVYRVRKSNLYNPKSKEPFSISRSKIELFLECPRCFYLDRRKGMARPSMPGWPLNSAVDQLLKNEFDLLRKKGQKHELMKQYNIDAIPYEHPDLSVWRGDVNFYSGAKILHKKTNFYIDGIIDDIWEDPKGNLVVVDYKSTSTSNEISLEDEYKQGFKRQAEIYQWIFRKMGFKVSDVAYFVYANASKNRPKFDGRLDFDLLILTHKGDDGWVEPTIQSIKTTLDRNKIPASGDKCEHCPYRHNIQNVEK